MKEELFQLIDGDLPDDSAAELLHMLSVDPDKRAMFRQQLKLQEALHYNGSHRSLTSGEEAEMVDRLGKAIGVGQGSSRKAFGPGLLGVVALLCLGLGGGIGYLSSTSTGPNEKVSTPPQQSLQHVEQSQPAAPPVVAVPFDRDSLIASLRDSVATAYQDSLASSQVVATPEPKRIVRKAPKRSTNSSAIDDPTGAKAAKKFGHHKK